MSFTDVRTLDESRRWIAADRAKQTANIALPELALWNYSPCAEHLETGVQSWCLGCGVRFRQHQQHAIAWLYYAKRGLLGDSCGTGKTIVVLGVMAMCAESGELGHDEYAGQRRALVVCQPAAVTQWREEIIRTLPGLNVITATGTVKQRQERYMAPWDVCVISSPMLATPKNRDQEILENFRLGLVVYDDVDAMRNHDNRTNVTVNRLCETAPRVIGLHATPLQKRVMELHGFLEPVGGREVLGSSAVCRHRFVQTRNIVSYELDRQTGRTVTRTVTKETGIKNGAEFRRLISSLVMRRDARDLDDTDMPEIVANPVWLDMTPPQRARYDELRRGVLRKMREDGEHLSQPVAVAMFTHGWQICSGLASLDAPEIGEADSFRITMGLRDQPVHHSAKLDWAADRIDGDFSEDKVVVFIHFRPNVADMARRLDTLGIGYTVLWSNETSPEERARRMHRFRTDPACRVLLGTTSIERSVNLQAARHLIAVDSVVNPARMTQIAGRIARDGSRHSTVYFHQLLHRGTQEEAILDILRREQALADYVWDEQSQIFEALSPRQLLGLIAGAPEIYRRAAA